MGRYIDGGMQDFNIMAEIGEGWHTAASKALCEYLESECQMGIIDFRNNLEYHLKNSRPDIQPQVLDASKASVWSWSKFITDSIKYPDEVVGCDGGDHIGKSGQLAAELVVDGIPCTLTSELDLLIAGPSHEVLLDYDWKAGWKFHTEEMVRSSIQFQWHAWLVHKNFDIEALRVRVWNVRKNAVTYAVDFKRDDVHKFEARISNVVRLHRKWGDKDPEEVEVYPSPEVCEWCPAAVTCSNATRAAVEIAQDPEAFIDHYAELQGRLEYMKKVAVKYTDKNGTIITEKGNAFGRDKPPSERKKPASLYVVSGDSEATDSSNPFNKFMKKGKK